ncbi:MAG: hypothetical protein K1X50_10455 [Candidatus Promineofilum sp.]|nr:hypothetical protein [Promineifilum sp.]
MTTTTLQTSRPKAGSHPTDRFEKWIQAPLTHYRSAYIGNEWQLFLTQPTVSTSASQASANTFSASLPSLFQSIAVEEERQLLTDWLSIAESAFDFWDNDLDAAYDNL